MKDYTGEEIEKILDQAEYELLDGIGMQYHLRTFSTEEYDTIKGVMEHIRQAFRYGVDKSVCGSCKDCHKVDRSTWKCKKTGDYIMRSFEYTDKYAWCKGVKA